MPESAPWHSRSMKRATATGILTALLIVLALGTATAKAERPSAAAIVDGAYNVDCTPSPTNPIDAVLLSKCGINRRVFYYRERCADGGSVIRGHNGNDVCYRWREAIQIARVDFHYTQVCFPVHRWNYWMSSRRAIGLCDVDSPNYYGKKISQMRRDLRDKRIRHRENYPASLRG